MHIQSNTHVRSSQLAENTAVTKVNPDAGASSVARTVAQRTPFEGDVTAPLWTNSSSGRSRKPSFNASAIAPTFKQLLDRDQPSGRISKPVMSTGGFKEISTLENGSQCTALKNFITRCLAQNGQPADRAHDFIDVLKRNRVQVSVEQPEGKGIYETIDKTRLQIGREVIERHPDSAGLLLEMILAQLPFLDLLDERSRQVRFHELVSLCENNPTGKATPSLLPQYKAILLQELVQTSAFDVDGFEAVSRCLAGLLPSARSSVGSVCLRAMNQFDLEKGSEAGEIRKRVWEMLVWASDEDHVIDAIWDADDLIAQLDKGKLEKLVFETGLLKLQELKSREPESYGEFSIPANLVEGLRAFVYRDAFIKAGKFLGDDASRKKLAKQFEHVDLPTLPTLQNNALEIIEILRQTQSFEAKISIDRLCRKIDQVPNPYKNILCAVFACVLNEKGKLRLMDQQARTSALQELLHKENPSDVERRTLLRLVSQHPDLESISELIELMPPAFLDQNSGDILPPLAARMSNHQLILFAALLDKLVTYKSLPPGRREAEKVNASLTGSRRLMEALASAFSMEIALMPASRFLKFRSELFKNVDHDAFRVSQDFNIFHRNSGQNIEGCRWDSSIQFSMLRSVLKRTEQVTKSCGVGTKLRLLVDAMDPENGQIDVYVIFNSIRESVKNKEGTDVERTHLRLRLMQCMERWPSLKSRLFTREESQSLDAAVVDKPSPSFKENNLYRTAECMTPDLVIDTAIKEFDSLVGNESFSLQMARVLVEQFVLHGSGHSIPRAAWNALIVREGFYPVAMDQVTQAVRSEYRQFDSGLKRFLNIIAELPGDRLEQVLVNFAGGRGMTEKSAIYLAKYAREKLLQPGFDSVLRAFPDKFKSVVSPPVHRPAFAELAHSIKDLFQ